MTDQSGTSDDETLDQSILIGAVVAGAIIGAIIIVGGVIWCRCSKNAGNQGESAAMGNQNKETKHLVFSVHGPNECSKRLKHQNLSLFTDTGCKTGNLTSVSSIQTLTISIYILRGEKRIKETVCTCVCNQPCISEGLRLLSVPASQTFIWRQI